MTIQRIGRIGAIPNDVMDVRVRSPIGRKPASWWAVAGKTCVAAYQAKGAASLAASYVNLANPGTYDAAPGVAPTFDAATGWIGNGTAYLRTGIIPAAGWSALCRFSGLYTNGGNHALFGTYTTNNAQFGFMSFFQFTSRYFLSGGQLIKSGAVSSGVYGIAGQTAYANGAAETGAISAWNGTASEIYILDANGADVKTTGTIAALVLYSDTLTAGEVAAVSAVMAAL